MKIIFIMVSICSSALFAQSVSPGLWQTKSSLRVAGLDLPESNGEECVTVDQAKDLKATLIKELEKNGCQSTKWVRTGSSVDISLKCQKSGLDAEGNLKGSVTAKEYKLAGTAEGTYHRIPAKADISLSGKWLKACP